MKYATLGQSVEILSLFFETPEDQIRSILESGLLADLRDGNISQVKRDEFRQLLGLPTESLLEYFGTVTIPATTEKFVASEKFIQDTGRKAKVKISYLGDNFNQWFLGDDGKVESLISEQTLRCARLKKASADELIVTEIGGEDKAETTLTEMFSLMERQGNGESGILLNSGYANILYIKDIAGVLRAVNVYWYDDGWRVNAYSVENPYWWDDGHRVFFRVPVAA